MKEGQKELEKIAILNELKGILLKNFRDQYTPEQVAAQPDLVASLEQANLEEIIFLAAGYIKVLFKRMSLDNLKRFNEMLKALTPDNETSLSKGAEEALTTVIWYLAGKMDTLKEIEKNDSVTPTSKVLN